MMVKFQLMLNRINKQIYLKIHLINLNLTINNYYLILQLIVKIQRIITII